MATQLFTRSLLLSSKPRQSLASLLSRSLSFSSAPAASAPRSPLSSLLRHRLRPLSSASAAVAAAPSARSFRTRSTSSSLNDPNPNWSNRPSKETILLDGCDFEHWLVVMEKPEGDPIRDEIIHSYIKTLAQVVGSEEEARMKVYSVSTRHYFAFGALVSEELSYKLKELPRVRWVLPDSYLDVKNKDYGGEPFINGQAVPYDPKYHEEWMRNNARIPIRPRYVNRSRNFDRRRENMQNRDFQARDMPNQGMQNPPPQGNMPPPNMGGGMPPPSNFARMPLHNQM
ncbi:multiple organellar RNA editing factor 8, chloroplastic/mitochondrial-like [Eucalyptus grandis]|uniref:multiple organellar RNA editing factor 8, chloroplastic/mitochondrial-like n=1 Tax=Eucalyptus grandis TaxID=71139 RepID=UPI00192ECE6C|nr:multiple organellar RNA editing factor 8, chloroplastic/mitochondrial-like [Eucalyptus grandis]